MRCVKMLLRENDQCAEQEEEARRCRHLGPSVGVLCQCAVLGAVPCVLSLRLSLSIGDVQKMSNNIPDKIKPLGTLRDFFLGYFVCDRDDFHLPFPMCQQPYQVGVTLP